MTTETQNISETINSINTNGRSKSFGANPERKMKALKPLSLRPTRSVKKNSSLKPQAIKLK